MSPGIRSLLTNVRAPAVCGPGTGSVMWPQSWKRREASPGGAFRGKGLVKGLDGTGNLVPLPSAGIPWGCSRVPQHDLGCWLQCATQRAGGRLGI